MPILIDTNPVEETKRLVDAGMPQQVATEITSQRHNRDQMYTEAITKQITKEVSDMESRLEQSNKLLVNSLERRFDELKSDNALLRAELKADTKLYVGAWRILLPALVGSGMTLLLIPAIRHYFGF